MNLNITKKTFLLLLLSCSLFLGGCEDRKRVIGYFTNWGFYSGGVKVTDIHAEKLTHLNYAFGKISDDVEGGTAGQFTLVDPWADVQTPYLGAIDPEIEYLGHFNHLKTLKKANPHLKILISFGGWTLSKNFSTYTRTADGRELLSQSALDFVLKYDFFDGVDLDWEYPGGGGLPDNDVDSNDRENFTELLRLIREKFNAQSGIDNKEYLLTAAVSAGSAKMDHLDLPQIMELVDFLNVMTYDYHGSWDAVTGHNSPLYSNPNDPSPEQSRTEFNSAWSMEEYLKRGGISNKLLIGSGFYAREWAGVPEGENGGLFMPAGGEAPPEYSQALGINKRVKEMLDSGEYTRYWDEHSKVPYLYSATQSNGHFLTYEDQESLQLKLEWMKENKLGGVFFWELNGEDDEPEHSMLDLINRFMEKTIKTTGKPKQGTITGDSCNFEYQVSYPWGGTAQKPPFKMEITVTNTSEENLEDWRVSFLSRNTLRTDVNNVDTLVEHKGNQYTFGNGDLDLAPGESATIEYFGFDGGSSRIQGLNCNAL